VGRGMRKLADARPRVTRPRKHAVRILLLLALALPVGWLILDWMRRPFSADAALLERWFEEQPVTVIAACMIVGSIAVWGVLTVLGVW